MIGEEEYLSLPHTRMAARRLRRARRMLHLTQEEVSARAGCGRRSAWAAENPRFHLTVRLAETIGSAVGLSLADLTAPCGRCNGRPAHGRVCRDCGTLGGTDPEDVLLTTAETRAAGARIAVLLSEHGMSQLSLALKAETSQTLISNTVNAKCRPQRDTAARIAGVFGLSLAELTAEVAATSMGGAA